MINLLPPEALGKFVQEYRHRRAIIAQGLIFCLLMIAVGLAIIFYFSFRVKARVISDELTRRESEFSAIISPAQRLAITALENRLRLILDFPRPTTSLSSVVAGVQSKLNSTVVLNSLNYQRESATKAILSLHGLAATRGALISFIESLKTEPLFTTIDSPVSNLIRDREVAFSIVINLDFTRVQPSPL